LLFGQPARPICESSSKKFWIIGFCSGSSYAERAFRVRWRKCEPTFRNKNGIKLVPALPEFWYNIPKREYIIYHMATKCTKWP
jgi:hypothetical protein